MTSLHYRSASATNGRNAHVSSGPSRVNSVRTRDYERPTLRDGNSPTVPDGSSEPGDSAHKHSKSENRFSGVERRKERTTVTTTETITRRSPRKETLQSSARKDDVDRRRSVGSPVLKRSLKERPQGMYNQGGVGTHVDCHRAMDSFSSTCPSLVRTSSHTRHSAASLAFGAAGT